MQEKFSEKFFLFHKVIKNLNLNKNLTKYLVKF